MRQQSDPQKKEKILQAMASDGEEEINEENDSASESENEDSENEGKKFSRSYVNRTAIIINGHERLNIIVNSSIRIGRKRLFGRRGRRRSGTLGLNGGPPCRECKIKSNQRG